MQNGKDTMNTEQWKWMQASVALLAAAAAAMKDLPALPQPTAER
jgi:hypothetical protein